MTDQHDPTRPPASNWPLEHPWLYIYTVITADLLALLAAIYLTDWLKGPLP